MKTYTRERLTYFNERYVSLKMDAVAIEERDPGGLGAISFTFSGECVQLLAVPNLGQFLWLKEAKCADGAFIRISEHNIELHIVELKSKLTHKGWESAKRQFCGMLLNALAFCGIVGLPPFSTVTCYIAFREENVSPSKTATPIALKRALGSAKAFAEVDDWLKGMVRIAWASNVPVVKIPRDAAGNGALTIV